MLRSDGQQLFRDCTTVPPCGDTVLATTEASRDNSYANGPPLVVDLFAGAGGFSLGAIQAGFEVRAAVEFSRHAAATYRKSVRNVTDKPIEVFDEDIAELNPHSLMDEAGLLEGQCDLLLGGPPCQGFSSHRLGDAGVNDPRNKLLMRYFAFVEAIAPRMFLLENVPGLLREKHADYLDRFLSVAREHGYEVFAPVVANARDYGVPQNRKRVFILGFDSSRVSVPDNWLPRPTHGDAGKPGSYGPLIPWRTASDAFSIKADPNDPNDIHMRHGESLVATFKSTPANGGSRSQSNRVLPCHQKHQGHRDVYGRIDPSKPSPTMTTACVNPSKGRFVHPVEHHGITARQAARLQTFPEDFVFEGGLMAAGVQIGNAVPVMMAKVLCENLLQHLGSPSDAQG